MSPRTRKFVLVAAPMIIALLAAQSIAFAADSLDDAQAARDASPTFLLFNVSAVRYEQNGDYIVVDATAVVDRVWRSERALSAGDVIHISYAADYRSRRPVADDTVRQSEIAPSVALKRLRVGDYVLGWFRFVADSRLVPAAGPNSFDYKRDKQSKSGYPNQKLTLAVDDYGYFHGEEVEVRYAGAGEEGLLFDYIREGIHRSIVLGNQQPSFVDSAGNRLSLISNDAEQGIVVRLTKDQVGPERKDFDFEEEKYRFSNGEIVGVAGELRIEVPDTIIARLGAGAEGLTAPANEEVYSFQVTDTIVGFHLASYQVQEEGSRKLAFGNDVVLAYETKQNRIFGFLDFLQANGRSSNGGCWQANTNHYILKDIDANGSTDIGLLIEHIDCSAEYVNREELDRSVRRRRYGTVEWYTFDGYGTWARNTRIHGSCPASYTGLFGSPGLSVSPVSFVEDFQPLEEPDSRAVPPCMAQLMHVGTHPQELDLAGDYFDFSYSNYAWGYRFRGIVVDTNGRVFSYDRPRMPAGQGDADGTQSRYSNLGEHLFTVPDDEMERAKSLLVGIEPGLMTERVNRGADMGGYTYTGYRFDPRLSRHQAITFAIDGDWESHNTSQGADELKSWLRSLERRRK